MTDLPDSNAERNLKTPSEHRFRFMFIEQVGRGGEFSELAMRVAIYVFQLRATSRGREFRVVGELAAKWLGVSRPTAFRGLAELVKGGALNRVKPGVYAFKVNLETADEFSTC